MFHGIISTSVIRPAPRRGLQLFTRTRTINNGNGQTMPSTATPTLYDLAMRMTKAETQLKYIETAVTDIKSDLRSFRASAATDSKTTHSEISKIHSTMVTGFSKTNATISAESHKTHCSIAELKSAIDQTGARFGVLEEKMEKTVHKLFNTQWNKWGMAALALGVAGVSGAVYSYIERATK